MPPTIYSGQESTYTGAVLVVRQLENHLQMLDPDQFPLLQAVGLNSYPYTLENTRYEWQMDYLNPITDTAAAAVQAGDLAITVTDADRFANMDLVLIDSEIVQVTELGAANTIVVTRGFGGTVAAAHDLGVTLYRLGSALPEGSAPGWAQQVQTVQPFNFTQIWDAMAEATGTQLATKKHGPDDTLAYNIDKRMRELYMMMERAYLYNVRFQPQTNTGRSTGGLDFFISDQRDLLGAAFTYTDMLNAAEDLFLRFGLENGPRQLWMNSNQMRQISQWNVASTWHERAETATGTIVRTLVTDFGTFSVHLDHLIKPDEIWLLNFEHDQCAPLSGRGFHTIDASVPGVDAKRERIIGEYGFVVKGENGVDPGPQIKFFGADLV